MWMLTGRMKAPSRNCRDLLITATPDKQNMRHRFSRSCRADLDVEPAERRGAHAVAGAQQHGRGRRFDHRRSVDHLARCERIELIDRHLAPLSEIDPALGRCGVAGGRAGSAGSCGRAGNSPITATRALTSTASWSLRL